MAQQKMSKTSNRNLLIAAQNQALGTSYREARIESNKESARCRMCKGKDETLMNVASGHKE